MAGLGVDISGQESETLYSYLDEPFGYAVTVCDAAKDACPIFPGAKDRLHTGPSGTPREPLVTRRSVWGCFREVRDGILTAPPVGREPLTS